MCVNDGEINLDNMDNVLSMLTSPMHVSIIVYCFYACLLVAQVVFILF